MNFPTRWMKTTQASMVADLRRGSHQSSNATACSERIEKRSASYPTSEVSGLKRQLVRPVNRSKSFVASCSEPKEEVKIRSVSFMSGQALLEDSSFSSTLLTPLRGRQKTLLGELDLEMYSDNETKDVNYEAPCEIICEEMASLKCMFQYLPDESTVLVELRDLITYFKPIIFHGVKISQSYEVVLDIKHLSSIKTSFLAANRSIKRKNSKESVELRLGQPVGISLKNKCPEKSVIRLVLYDSNKRNKFLACGYIHVKVRDITSNPQALEIQEPFHPSSKAQPAQKGTITGSIEWNESLNRLHVKVLSASTIKNNRKEYFVKATVFIGNFEMTSLKTESVLSQHNEIRIREKLSFSIPSKEKMSEIYRTSILLQMYEKNRITNEIFGKIIIGPNMHTECRKSISCWHKILRYPNKEIQFQELPLYL